MLEVVRPPVPSARGGAIAYQASFSPDPPSHFIFFSSSQIYRAFSSLQFFFHVRLLLTKSSYEWYVLNN